MGWANVLKTVGPSIGSAALGSIMAGNNPAPGATQLPWSDQAASSLYGDISSMSNPYPAMQPLEYQQLMAMLNNPELKGYMTGAKQAGNMYGRAGAQAGQGANMLMGNASSLYQQGMDPQNALRDRMQQQTMDQSNVTNAMYGLSGSGAGAGIAGQNLNNFNIDWQNQQLQRQLAAGQGIGRDVTGAQQLYGAGAQDYLAKGQVPYDAYKGAIGDMSGAINTYMGGAEQGNNLSQGAIGDWLQYLGMGQGATSLNQGAYGMNQDTASMYGAAAYPLMEQAFNSFGKTPPASTRTA